MQKFEIKLQFQIDKLNYLLLLLSNLEISFL